MKKLIYMAGAALVMLASASCEKKETVKEAQSSVEKAEMVFTATSDNGGLKTTIVDNTKAVWSSTDNLKVFTAEDTPGSVCGYKSGAGTATAEFTGQCAKKGPWTAICPANKATGFNNGTITLTMPEAQTYAANTFADGAMPCVAYSETNTFNFKHSFGVLKLSLKLKSGTTGSVKSITVTTKGSEKLWGAFTVNPQTSAVATKSGSDGCKSITLNCGSGVALSTSTAKDFWIVVPQSAFASGFDVTVTPTSTVLLPAAISTIKSNAITAGEVTKMPVQVIEFVDSSTGYAEITGGVNVKWIQLWAGGPKWAEYNVGAAFVGSYGDYYGWGGSTNKSSSDYAPSTVTTDIQYNSTYDTARKKWGSNWQMPTQANYDALLNNCSVAWKSESESGHGFAGLLVTGKGDYSGNSVFFPAGGYYGGSNVSYAGNRGYYWSSTPASPINAFDLYFISSTTKVVSNDLRYCGCSVRAVLKE